MWAYRVSHNLLPKLPWIPFLISHRIPAQCSAACEITSNTRMVQTNQAHCINKAMDPAIGKIFLGRLTPRKQISKTFEGRFFIKNLIKKDSKTSRIKVLKGGRLPLATQGPYQTMSATSRLACVKGSHTPYAHACAPAPACAATLHQAHTMLRLACQWCVCGPPALTT